MPSVQRTHTIEMCYPCKWLKRQLWMSGRNPIYETTCIHPTKLRDSAIYGTKGEFIGRTPHEDIRPNWCPIRGDAQAEADATEDDE